MTMIAIEATQGVTFPSIVIFERENDERKKLNERLASRKDAARRGELEQDITGLIRARKPFTWERLSYSVPVSGGHKRLLNDVYGYVVVRCPPPLALFVSRMGGAEKSGILFGIS